MINEIEIGERIIKDGEAFNHEIADDQKRLFKAFKPGEGFFVAVANSLAWAGRAIDDQAYFQAAVYFLASGEEKFLDTAKEYSLWHGAENLFQSLYAWRQIISSIQVPSVDKISVKGLLDLQSECRSRAIVLHRGKKIKGIDAWFLCAPFKMIAVYRKDLWKDDALDEIRMPTGMQVVRAAQELFKKKVSWVNGYEELRDCFKQQDVLEGGLSKEGLVLTEFIHGISRKIACDKRLQCLKSSRCVIHVNSGLYLFGKKAIG